MEMINKLVMDIDPHWFGSVAIYLLMMAGIISFALFFSDPFGWSRTEEEGNKPFITDRAMNGHVPSIVIVVLLLILGILMYTLHFTGYW